MEDLFSSEFYQLLISKIYELVIEILPALVLITVTFFILLKIVKVLLNRFKSVITKRISSTQNQLEQEKRVNTLMGIAQGVIVTTLWVVFLMMFLQKLGVNIGPILAGAGVIGLAVGFGAQELVRDAISGFFLLLENRIRTGDVAVVNGTGGLVEDINLRTITLRDLTGTVHTFQNGKINTLSNMTKDWSAMVFDIGVAYKENVDNVIEIIKKVGEELKSDAEFESLILEPIEVFGLDKFGDSAVVIKARLKTVPIQQWTVGRAFNKRLKSAFDEANIEIPFPHRTIYWGDEINPLNLKITDDKK